MTLEELSRGYKLTRKVQEDKEILCSLRAKAHPGAQNLDGMPRSSGPGDKVGSLAIEIADLETQIEGMQEQIRQAEAQTVAYIETIHDAKLRTIFRLRFVRYMTWAEVADIMGTYYTEKLCQDTVYRFMRADAGSNGMERGRAGSCGVERDGTG